MRTITRGTRKEEIHIRELSDAECDCMVKAIEVVSRMNFKRTPSHLRDDLMSFLNEESFMYACKYDGKTGDLTGYLISSMNMRVTSFLNGVITKEQRNIYDRQEEFDSENSLWDYIEVVDSFDESDIYMELSSLPEREKLIAKYLYEGYSMEDIQSFLKLSEATVKRSKYKMQDNLKGVFCPDFKRKESNFTKYNKTKKGSN